MSSTDNVLPPYNSQHLEPKNIALASGTNNPTLFQAKYGGQLFYHHKHFLLTFWITQFSEATSSGLKRELEGKSRKTSLYCGYSTTTSRSSGQQKIVEFLRANKPYEQLFKNETLTPHKNGSNAARENHLLFFVDFVACKFLHYKPSNWVWSPSTK